MKLTKTKTLIYNKQIKKEMCFDEYISSSIDELSREKSGFDFVSLTPISYKKDSFGDLHLYEAIIVYKCYDLGDVDEI